MLYNFIDTIDMKQQGSTLPAEAMNYDGVFLENEISGYRTLKVTGRELLGSEIRTKNITGLDGTLWQGRNYKPRTITVQYLLMAKTDADFRKAYNKMNLLLSGEQVKIYFNDETDKYFVGTKISNDEVEGGSNVVIGEIEIYCADPLKYSTTEKEFIATDGVLNIVNEGTVPVSIDYDIQLKGQTGYIGIVSTEGAMQYGYIDDKKKTSYKQNEELATLTNFFNAKDDVNGTDYMHPNYGANGTLKQSKWYDKPCLVFGTPGTKKGWAFGGLRTVELPADSNGIKGSVNFHSEMHVWFQAGLMGQVGEMCVNYLTSDNKLICGFNWYKSDTSGNTGHHELLANGKVLKNWYFTTSHLYKENPFAWDWGATELTKTGSKIQFQYAGAYYDFDIPELESMECTKVQIAIKQCDGYDGNRIMTRMGFDEFSFEKMNVTKWVDVPNRYPNKAKITINGATSRVYVNRRYRPQDEVIGTTYFKAPVGTTEVKLAISEWSNFTPVFKAKIREAWL